ncbi:MAG: MATE family efflux transporter [Bacillota bacterium]|nr:MATE family efflux transporter [Bacillota bacterium]
MNNLLTKYGAQSAYGADIPLASLGIVMKVNSIIISFMVGLGIGSQPIVGYNYGAKNYARVKAAYIRTVITGLTVGIIGWAVFQFCTQPIIDLFGHEDDALYNQFANKCFHIFLSVIFLTGFLIPSGIFFQSIGKPLKAMASTLTRQLIYFLPCAFIMSSIMGVEGLLYAGPTGDILAAITVAVLVITEMRNLNKKIADGN